MLPVDPSTFLSVTIISPSIETITSQQQEQSTNRHSLPVILFIHGLGSNKRIWTETAEALCVYGYSSILVDLRGHGLSDHSSSIVDNHKGRDSDCSTRNGGRFHSATNKNDDNNGSGNNSFKNSDCEKERCGFNLISNNSKYSLAQSANDLSVIIQIAFSKYLNMHNIDMDTSHDNNSNNINNKTKNNTNKNATYQTNNDTYDANEIQPPSVVAIGHSYGGNIAVELALKYKTLVSSIVLVDGGYIDLKATFPDFDSCIR
jgi:pimeloyl-ACP methyl ester carboxylesterase